MARGQIAKDLVEKKIIEAFGQNYIGIQDKKLYVIAKENGEDIQIAISLTCPKVPLDLGEKARREAEMDIDAGGAFGAASVQAPVYKKATEISEEEKYNLQKLMERLGI